MTELTCSEARPAIHLLLDGELPPDRAALLYSHLHACAQCRREQALAAAEAEVLKASLADMVDEMPSPRALPQLASAPALVHLKHALAAAAAVVILTLGFILLTHPLGKHEEAPSVMVKRAGADEWKTAGEQTAMGPGDSLRTASDWRATLYLTSRTRLALKESTEVTFDRERPLSLSLARGEVWLKAAEGEHVLVSVGKLSVEAEAAEFIVSKPPDEQPSPLSFITPAWAGVPGECRIAVLEGSVLARADGQEWRLGPRDKLAWTPQGASRESLQQSEVSAYRWEDSFPDPYSGKWVSRQGGSSKYKVLNPFGVNPTPPKEKEQN